VRIDYATIENNVERACHYDVWYLWLKESARLPSGPGRWQEEYLL